MTKFASGKNAFAISDRSGIRYRYKDMRKEWNGALVGKDEFESKHPQLGPFRKVIDAQALKDARPEINLAAERSIQYGFAPVGFREIAGITPRNNLVGFGEIGSVVVTTTTGTNETITVTGVEGTISLGSITVNTAPRFDNTNQTLDSTTDTFDEG